MDTGLKSVQFHPFSDETPHPDYLHPYPRVMDSKHAAVGLRVDEGPPASCRHPRRRDQA